MGEIPLELTERERGDLNQDVVTLGLFFSEFFGYVGHRLETAEHELVLVEVQVIGVVLRYATSGISGVA